MSKRILVLSSSPRKGGNSELLCDQFIAGAREAGHDAEKLSLRGLRIHYCTGCGSCHRTKRGCPQNDDMPEVLNRMLAADVIVMATPVYFYTMCGQLKTLIDRTCARYTEISNKEFYFILAAADTNKPAMEKTVESLRGFTSCLNGAREKGIVYGTGAWNVGDIKNTQAMEEARRMGKAA